MEIRESIDTISYDTVKYSEEVVSQFKSNLEFKSLKDSRNKLISKKDILEENIKQIRKNIEHLKREQRFTPVKSVKTPKNSLFSLTKLKLFEQMTSLENENNQVQTLTDVDQDIIIDELETKISVLKKENTEFFVFVDELNDSSNRVETQNSFLKSGLKNIDKQLSELTKERSNLLKLYSKHFTSAVNSDLIKSIDTNIGCLDKACHVNLSADIISYLNKEK